MAAAPLVYDTSFDPPTGQLVQLGPALGRVTAPNRGPHTFTGTNTYLLGEQRLFVVDPGPDDDSHLAALRLAIGGRPVGAVILTHTHRDHSALARRLATEVGAPLWFGGRHRLSRPRRRFELNPVGRDSDWSLVPDRTLGDGERIEGDGVTLEVIATPGHCSNHLAFGLLGTPDLLSGDHVMGWNSTLVPVPDGSMRDYLQSLKRLIAAPYQRYHPGHGGPIADGPGQASALLEHRELRNRQIEEALRKGPRTLGQLVRTIYPDLPPKLRIAAGMTLQAHIEYLEENGVVRVSRGWRGLRVALGQPGAAS